VRPKPRGIADGLFEVRWFGCSKFQNATAKNVVITFFDKTDVNLLIYAFNAATRDKKNNVCLQIAEEMCRLRPENALHWYILVSALHKMVLMQLKAVHDKALRVAVVAWWIRQPERCIKLFEFCKKEPGEKSGFTGMSEMTDSIQNHLLLKFRDTPSECQRVREEEGGVPERGGGSRN
jgi:hypothetical protein